MEKLGASKLNNAQLGCWIHASSEVNAHAEQLAGQAASLAQEAIRRRGADWVHVQGLILQGGIEEGSVRWTTERWAHLLREREWSAYKALLRLMPAGPEARVPQSGPWPRLLSTSVASGMPSRAALR